MSLARGLTQNSPFSFDFRLDKQKWISVQKSYSPEVKEIIDEHLRECFREAGGRTAQDINKVRLAGKYNLHNIKEDRSILEVIKESLAFQFHFENQYQMGYRIGSFDPDDTEEPTGVKSTHGKNNLIDLYEEGTGPFRYSGFIDRGTSRFNGQLKSNMGDDRLPDDGAEELWVKAEKRMRPLHPGLPAVRPIGRLQENLIATLQDKDDEIKSRLSNLSVRERTGIARRAAISKSREHISGNFAGLIRRGLK